MNKAFLLGFVLTLGLVSLAGAANIGGSGGRLGSSSMVVAAGSPATAMDITNNQCQAAGTNLATAPDNTYASVMWRDRMGAGGPTLFSDGADDAMKQLHDTDGYKAKMPMPFDAVLTTCTLYHEQPNRLKSLSQIRLCVNDSTRGRFATNELDRCVTSTVIEDRSINPAQAVTFLFNYRYRKDSLVGLNIQASKGEANVIGNDCESVMPKIICVFNER